MCVHIHYSLFTDRRPCSCSQRQLDRQTETIPASLEEEEKEEEEERALSLTTAAAAAATPTDDGRTGGQLVEFFWPLGAREKWKSRAARARGDGFLYRHSATFVMTNLSSG